MALTAAQAVVQVVPSMKGFGAKVKADVTAIKAPDVKVQVNLDKKSLAAAEAEVRAASARMGKARDAEIGASERVQVAEAKLAQVRRTAAAGSAELVQAETRLAAAKRASVAASSAASKANVDHESAVGRVSAAQDRLASSSARAGSSLTRLKSAVSGISGDGVKKLDRDLSRTVGNATRLGASVFGAASAVTTLGAATPVVLGLGAALVSAAGAAALLPAALAAAGAGFATLKIGTTGIADAFKAQGAASTGAAAAGAKSASAQAAQQKQIRDGLQGVDQAASQAARTRIDGEQRVRDAVESSKQTQVSGSRAIASAQEAVSAAKDRAEQAESDYRDAVKEATLAIRDQKVELRSSSLSVEEAQLSLERAIERQKQLKAEGASGLDMREADLGIRRATVSLEEAKNRYTDVKRESVRTSVQGVSAARNVQDAQEGLIDANAGVQSAEKDLQQVRSDAAADNNRAQQEIKAAQADAAQANSDAALRVRDAQERLSDAYTKTGESADASGAKAAEAMAALSPNAQAFVRSVLGMRSAWDGLKNSVQDRLFAGFAGEVAALGGTYLPILRNGLTGIAGGFNTAALDASGFLRSAQGVSGVSTILDNTSTATGNLARAAAPLTSAFVGIAAIGSQFLPGLASGFANAAERAAAFVNSAAGAEKIRGWIAGGLEAIRQLWTLLSNVGSIIGTVFSTANQVGGSTIQMLNQIVGAFAAWLKSAEGQTLLVTLFTTIRDVVNSLLPGVRAIADALYNAFLSIAPSLPAVGEAFSAVARSVAPLIEDLGALIGWILPPLAGLLEFLAPAAGFLATVILTVVGAVKLFSIVMGILNAVMALSPMTWLILGIVALVGAIIYIATQTTWFQDIWSGVMNFLSTSLQFFKNLWNTVWTWVSNLFTTVMNWIRNTAVTVWTAIVNFLTTAINGFRNFFVTLWNGIGNFFVTIWNWLRNTITTVWNAIVSWFTTALNNFVGFFRGIWDGISRFFSGIWEGLKSTVVNMWNSIWTWVSKAIEGFAGWFGRTWDGIVNGFKKTWEKIRGIAKAPIRWVLETVWNNGIGGMWDKAKSFLGLGEFPRADIAAFDRMATGGAVRGPGTGTSDSIPTLLSNGEHVLTAAEVKAAGGHGGVMRMREQIRAGVVPEHDGFLRRALGGPVSWQEMWAAVRPVFPQARLTSSYRPGDSGYHGKGKAVDLAGPRSMDLPYMKAINYFLAQKYPGSAQLIHTQPGAINLLNGRPHAYNRQTQEEHRDHVHWANGGMGDQIKGNIGNAWGDFMSLVDQVRDAISGPISWLRGQKFAGGGMMGTVPGAVADWGIGKVSDWLFGKASEMDAAGGGGGLAAGGTGPVADQVRAVANRWGWGGGPQWNAIVKLLGGESSWNPNIKNPTSSAYGLFQFLDATWGTVGGRKTSNPGEQAEYGFRYIKQRYTDPIGALAKWQSRNPHWYHQGGSIPGLGNKVVMAQGGERVLSIEQNRNFEMLTGALADVKNRRSLVPADVRRGRDLAGVGARPVSKTIHNEFSGDIRESVDIDLAMSKVAFHSGSL